MLKYFLLWLLLWAKNRNEYGYILHHGVAVSKVQLKLAVLLGVSSEYINYPIGPYYADIAYPEDKIVIEYDGWHWHKNKDDYERTQYLLRRGWKVIKIKSNSKLPYRATVRQMIVRAKKGKRYQELVLKDWGHD